MYKNLLFSSLLLRQQTAAAGAVPKQLNNKNVNICTFSAKNMATNGIFGKYVNKKMEKQARKVSFWVNEPFETKVCLKVWISTYVYGPFFDKIVYSKTWKC